MDKAGAYGIQGYGATIVDRIDGDFFAVMGLPLVTLVRLLQKSGCSTSSGNGWRANGGYGGPGFGGRTPQGHRHRAA